MKIHTQGDVDALLEYKKIDKGQIITKRIKRLGYLPFIYAMALIIYSAWLIISGATSLSPADLILVAVAMSTMGYSSLKRSELERALFTINYIKNQD